MSTKTITLSIEDSNVLLDVIETKIQECTKKIRSANHLIEGILPTDLEKFNLSNIHEEIKKQTELLNSLTIISTKL